MADILSRIENLNVLVVGDLMVDRYFTGKVSRISPEAPVPVVEWIEEEDRLGGAANVALNITSMGASAYLCGVVGKDSDSEHFYSLLEQNDLKSELILQSDSRPTSTKTRVIADKQHLLRLDKETTDYLNEYDERLLLEKLIQFFKGKAKVDVIILQDYNKGVLTKNVIKFIINTAKKKSIPIAVDPKRQNFWEYRGVNLFKPNLQEVQDALPFDVFATKDSLKKAAAFIHRKFQYDLLFITLSERGVFADSETTSSIFPTQKRKVADVCGAGDGVIAITSMAMALGMEVEDIAYLANLVGGQIVESIGVVPINKEMLKRELYKGQGKEVL